MNNELYQLAKDKYYMKIAIELAKNVLGNTSPNPAVGAVIVKNGNIIGKGNTQPPGQNHAEVEAIIDAGSDVEGSTMYVTLEPCNHYGKTPPCTDRIIASKIERVVIATRDPNPKAAGGIEKLLSFGIKVNLGVCENEAKKVNEAFLTFVTKKRPFVALKAATSLDGKIALNDGYSKWITNAKSRKYVHILRKQYDAVLVGSGTVNKDNPQLTVRMVKGKNPIRIVLSKSLNLNPNQTIFNDKNQTIIFTWEKSNNEKFEIFESKGIEIYKLNEDNANELNLKTMLDQLYKLNILSLLIEGGGKVFTSFIKQKLVDKGYFFIAPKIIGKDGISVFNELQYNEMNKISELNDLTFTQFDDNMLVEGYF